MLDGGTSLGNLVFLDSADDGPPPSPATCSVNAIAINEGAIGNPAYAANGTVYTVETGNSS